MTALIKRIKEFNRFIRRGGSIPPVRPPADYEEVWCWIDETGEGSGT